MTDTTYADFLNEQIQKSGAFWRVVQECKSLQDRCASLEDTMVMLDRKIEQYGEMINVLMRTIWPPVEEGTDTSRMNEIELLHHFLNLHADRLTRLEHPATEVPA